MSNTAPVPGEMREPNGDDTGLSEPDGGRLSFVLPVALGHTGRPGSDLERVTLLFESFVRCFPTAEIGAFLIITRPQDMQAVSDCVADAELGTFVHVVDETTICPELADDPDTFHEFPTRNKGWFRQQLLKLGAANHLDTDFFMTLDADVVFVKPFRAADVVRGGRSMINAQTTADFTSLFTDAVAQESARIRVDRDMRAEAILRLERTANWFYGETPVVLSTTVTRALLSYLETLHQENWCRFLIDNTPWTEFSLYFAFAEGTRLFDSFHIKGGLNSVLRMSDSLWYDATDYRLPRTLENWTWTERTDRDAVAVVVQSYLGYDVRSVRAKILQLSKTS
jgi:Family of unknown function (DUF6492)